MLLLPPPPAIPPLLWLALSKRCCCWPMLRLMILPNFFICLQIRFSGWRKGKATERERKIEREAENELVKVVSVTHSQGKEQRVYDIP
uniref:Putative secreted protein n=1 Tax=Anopheles darlingi TaxID=43151 RepID=A0A2M4DAN3_ANODA